MTANDIKKELDEALKMFGTYSFDDKGAGEVMDVDKIAKQLSGQPADEVAQILEELVDTIPEERGKMLVEEILSYLRDEPEEWLDAVMTDKLKELD